MFEIHPPHSPIHGWRDLFLQLVTITVGLLIALALEGLAEWLHHRHIMHQAQASLYVEIKANAGNLPSVLNGLHAQQKGIAARRLISEERDRSSGSAHSRLDRRRFLDEDFPERQLEHCSGNGSARFHALQCRAAVF